MLKNGADGLVEVMEEARRLGIVMSTEDATAAAELTDAWTRLTSVLKMAVARVGGALAPRLTELAGRITPAARPGDHAQAMMDLGATICTPRSPACGLCPWREPCRARIEGTQESFPRKAAKKTGKTRYGAAFVAMREDGRKDWMVLLRAEDFLNLLRFK